MISGNLQAIFGDEIAGIPTKSVLVIMQAQVRAAERLCNYPSQNKAEEQGTVCLVFLFLFR